MQHPRGAAGRSPVGRRRVPGLLGLLIALVTTACTGTGTPTPTPLRSQLPGQPTAVATASARPLNCLPAPHKCGYPDETNTGVPDGAPLVRVPQDATAGPGWMWRDDVRALVVDGPDTVVSGLDITDGMVIVYDPRVVIRDVRLTTRQPLPVDCAWGGDTRAADSCLGLVIEDSEIIGLDGGCQVGLAYRGYTARRVHITRCQDGFKADEDVLIEDSFVDHLWFAREGNQATHNDAVQTTGGTNVTLRHNTFAIGDQPQANAVVQFGTEDRPTISGWLIEDNLIDGGGLAFNARPPVTDTIVRGNRFTARVGRIGDLPLARWEGNFRDADGSPVP